MKGQANRGAKVVIVLQSDFDMMLQKPSLAAYFLIKILLKYVSTKILRKKRVHVSVIGIFLLKNLQNVIVKQ